MMIKSGEAAKLSSPPKPKNEKNQFLEPTYSDIILLIVERTFSWLEKCRRLTSDFEFFSNSLQAMVQLAFIRLMLNRFIV